MTDECKHEWDTDCFEEDITCKKCEIRLDVYEATLAENKRVLDKLKELGKKQCNCGHPIEDHAWSSKIVGCRAKPADADFCVCRNTIEQEIDSLRLKGDEKK